MNSKLLAAKLATWELSRRYRIKTRLWAANQSNLIDQTSTGEDDKERDPLDVMFLYDPERLGFHVKGMWLRW